MGYKEWFEDEEYTIETPKKTIKRNRKVKQYRITCDYCGEVIIDTSQGILGNGYVKVGDKYYHPQCYEVIIGE